MDGAATQCGCLLLFGCVADCCLPSDMGASWQDVHCMAVCDMHVLWTVDWREARASCSPTCIPVRVGSTGAICYLLCN